MFMFIGQLAARFQIIGGGIYIVESIKEVQRLTPIAQKKQFSRVFDIPIFGVATTKSAGDQSAVKSTRD